MLWDLRIIFSVVKLDADVLPETSSIISNQYPIKKFPKAMSNGIFVHRQFRILWKTRRQLVYLRRYIHFHTLYRPRHIDMYRHRMLGAKLIIIFVCILDSDTTNKFVLCANCLHEVTITKIPNTPWTQIYGE